MIEGAECGCGKRVVAFRKICPNCGEAMQSRQFENKGTVLTFTTLHTVPEGFQSPLKFAIIDIGEGAKLICTADVEKELNIGDTVKIIQKENGYSCQPFE